MSSVCGELSESGAAMIRCFVKALQGKEIHAGTDYEALTRIQHIMDLTDVVWYLAEHPDNIAPLKSRTLSSDNIVMDKRSKMLDSASPRFDCSKVKLFHQIPSAWLWQLLMSLDEEISLENIKNLSSKSGKQLKNVMEYITGIPLEKYQAITPTVLLYIYIYMYIRRAFGPWRVRSQQSILYPNPLRGFNLSPYPSPGRSWGQKLVSRGFVVA